VNRSRALLLCFVAGLAASFALAGYHPFGNADLYAPNHDEAPFRASAEIPPTVRSILIEKCADCHSNRTNAPFYGRLAPVSWLLERDVIEARKAMNLSSWASYSQDKRDVLLAKVLHEAKSGAMPPLQYRFIHWSARMTESDLKVIGQYANRSGSTSTNSSSDDPGDPEHGKALFEKRCTGCHALTQNKEGPRLQSVFGRTSGSISDFAYSKALRSANIVWDGASLDKWLTDPDAFVAGNEMDFAVSNSQERRDIISYLRQNSGR
jgi:cytochrome c